MQKIEAEMLARELHARYEPPRAVTLLGRMMLKALFAGRSDEVVFWALVHAHYCGGALCPVLESELVAVEDLLQRRTAKSN